MKKTTSRLLALALTASLLLAGCGGTGNGKTDDKKTADPASAQTSSDKKDDKKSEDQKEAGKTDEDKYQIKDLVLSQLGANELESFNILYANNQKEHDILCNVWGRPVGK